MRVLELFSGTGTLSRVARERGHGTFTIDLHQPADWNGDILWTSAGEIERLTGWNHIDLLWASPPCDGFSVASIGKMWDRADNGMLTAKHPTSQTGRTLLRRTLALISALNPTVWAIENPRGMMRTLPELYGVQRHTVTYCQYGEDRMKPTDIWTNNREWIPRPACKNGDTCHVSAPRGSRTGTQGIKGKKARAVLPEELCLEFIEAAEVQAVMQPRPPAGTALLFPSEYAV